MYTCMQTIVDLLSEYQTEALGADDVFYYDSIKKMEEIGWEKGESDIYLLTEDEYLQSGHKLSGPCYILVGNRIKKSDLPQNNNRFLLVNTPEDRISDIYMVLKEEYYQRLDYANNLKNRLIHIMSSTNSLQSVLTACTAEIKNPFIIYDNNYSLVSHSIPKTLNIPAARNVVRNGYANIDIIAEMEKRGELIYVFMETEHPLLIHIPNGYEKLVVSIYNKGQYAGVLCLMNYVKKLEEIDYEIIQFLGYIVRIYFKNLLADNSSWTPWDYLFTVTLKQKKSISEQDLEHLDIKLPQQMIMMVVCSRNEHKGGHLRYVQSHLVDRVPGVHMYYLDNYLVIVGWTKQLLPDLTRERWQTFRDLLDRLYLIAGISQEFHDINDMTFAFEQARNAALLGMRLNPDMTIHFYSSYIFHHMLSELEAQSSIERFYSDSFQKLIAYDKNFDTSYVEFILIYLICNCSTKICSEIYNLHYNSVKYRLNTIQNIADFDLKISSDLVHMYNSARIYLHTHPHALDQWKEVLLANTGKDILL